MDPVNPAPAGNPQLTTHLLVSHKKNKNFHPCKLKLRKTNVKVSTFSLDNSSLLKYILKQHVVHQYEPVYSSNGRTLRISDYHVTQPNTLSWFAAGVQNDQFLFKFKLSFDKIGVPEGWPKYSSAFFEPKLSLVLFSVLGKEIFNLNEEGVDSDLLQEQISWHTYYFEKHPEVKSLEFERTWDVAKLRVTRRMLSNWRGCVCCARMCLLERGVNKFSNFWRSPDILLQQV